MSVTEKFTALFDGLEECDEEEQVQKIMEMNGLIDEMNKEEFESIFTIELFNKIHQMIEKEKLPWGNAILLMKHVGYYQMLKRFYDYAFIDSLLSDRFQELIIEEEEKKGEKNERLLVDLCECYLLQLDYNICEDLVSICVPCLLKVASKKERNEETQKEVEIALFGFNCIDDGTKIKKEIFKNEIKEIVYYQQEHRNLTHLAYQSAWMFLICGFPKVDSSEEVIVNELHFGREARREIEDLSKCIDWKRKEEENGRIEVHIIERWLDVIDNYLTSCELWNEELAGLINCIVQVLRASRDNHKDIRNRCFDILRCAAENRNVEIDSF
eukprot:MONOS_8864.1-p1 / transcript=MONOS_8864.1 / gene=MONOS_8864 / organism=Monocercomonoides_exilis_PA203 / gene_product=unspecified product / transcript_product=unspecified product / location=Mono_scaffold00347:10654-12085(-) / protein_length=327 / sequence_SO=supercontig / SO=protein_coding / is_pseudo=false